MSIDLKKTYLNLFLFLYITDFVFVHHGFLFPPSWLVVLCLIYVVLTRPSCFIDSREFLYFVIPWALILMYSVISMTWSTCIECGFDDIKILIQYFIVLILLLFLMNGYNPIHGIFLYILGIFLLGIYGIIFTGFFGYSSQLRYTPISSMNPKIYSFLAIQACIAAFYIKNHLTFKFSKIIFFSLISILIFLIIIGQIRNTIFASILGFIFALFFSSKFDKYFLKLFVVLLLSGILFFIIGPLLPNFGFDYYEFDLNKFSSGRLSIWQDYIGYLSNNISLFGDGFGSVSVIAKSMYTKATHSTLLKIILEQGLFGFIIFVLSNILFLLGIYNLTNRNFYALWLYFFIFFTNFANSEFWSKAYWGGLFILVLIIARERNFLKQNYI